MLGLLVTTTLTVGLALSWRQMRRGHEARIRRLEVRIHVNGIRGKSTVTRLVAAVLREGGFVTVAKTTGSAARVIGPAGEEMPIPRRGAATINEQVDIVRRWVGPNIEALVIECMAVNPVYQLHAQERIVRSDITVITNVREDHQELMGETLEEIADSLSLTIPRSGTLIAAEDRPHLRARLAANAARRHSGFRYADAEQVSEEDMRGFEHVEFKANVAVGLEVADLLGIDRDVAMRGMWKAVPDIGALRLGHYVVRGVDTLWVPLFAANDRESVVAIFETLTSHLAGRRVIGILNNRWDRGRRADLFAHMVPQDLAPFLDHVITFGAYEPLVTSRMVQLGYPAERITNLGETVDPTLDQILDAIVRLADGRPIALVGLVNIHTAQAELLLHHFSAERGEVDDLGLELSRREDRLPAAVWRHRHALRRARLPRLAAIEHA